MSGSKVLIGMKASPGGRGKFPSEPQGVALGKKSRAVFAVRGPKGASGEYQGDWESAL